MNDTFFRRAQLLAGTSALALACVGMAPQQASAADMYGGGASLPYVADRALFNCYGPQPATGSSIDDTALFPGHSYNTITPAQCSTHVDTGHNFHYADSGSGAGRNAILTDNPTFYTTGVNPVGDVMMSVHYTGSDGKLSVPNEISRYVSGGVVIGATASGTTISVTLGDGSVGRPTQQQKFGPLIQIPYIATPIVMAYDSMQSGLSVQKTDDQTPATTALNLSKLAVCGIWHATTMTTIDDWNDPLLTSLNGAALVTGAASQPITRVFRLDGSGTTALFSNWLSNTSNCPGSGYTQNAANMPTFISSAAGFVGASQSDGVAASLAGASGTYMIGYIGPDWVGSVSDRGGTLTHSAIQGNKTDFTSAFLAPTIANFLNTISDAANNVTVPTGTSQTNPDNWVQNPSSPGHNPPDNVTEYPIGGFTNLDLYSCYAATDVQTTLVSYLTWFLAGRTATPTDPDNIIGAKGFVSLPDGFKTAILDAFISGSSQGNDLLIETAHPGSGTGKCSLATIVGG